MTACPQQAWNAYARSGWNRGLGGQACAEFLLQLAGETCHALEFGRSLSLPFALLAQENWKDKRSPPKWAFGSFGYGGHHAAHLIATTSHRSSQNTQTCLKIEEESTPHTTCVASVWYGATPRLFLRDIARTWLGWYMHRESLNGGLAHGGLANGGLRYSSTIVHDCLRLSSFCDESSL